MHLLIVKNNPLELTMKLNELTQLSDYELKGKFKKLRSLLGNNRVIPDTALESESMRTPALESLIHGFNLHLEERFDFIKAELLDSIDNALKLSKEISQDINKVSQFFTGYIVDESKINSINEALLRENSPILRFEKKEYTLDYSLKTLTAIKCIIERYINNTLKLVNENNSESTKEIELDAQIPDLFLIDHDPESGSKDTNDYLRNSQYVARLQNDEFYGTILYYENIGNINYQADERGFFSTDQFHDFIYAFQTLTTKEYFEELSKFGIDKKKVLEVLDHIESVISNTSLTFEEREQYLNKSSKWIRSYIVSYSTFLLSLGETIGILFKATKVF